MERKLMKFFEANSLLKRVPELEVRHINALFFSTQQIFAVTCYETEEIMKQSWERASHQLAHKIQNNLPTELDELRWDIYLIIFINQQAINNEVKKLIENNRFYFRKIILTKSDLDQLSEKLPLHFKLEEGTDETHILFNDRDFLTELKSSLSEKAVLRLGKEFFDLGARDIDELIDLFNIQNKGGNLDED